MEIEVEEAIAGLKFDADEEADFSVIPRYYKPKIVNGDSTNLSNIPDNSIGLTITSVPYNVGKDYSGYNDKQLWYKYIGMLYKMFKEVYRVTRTGGRVAINVGNLERKPYLNLAGLISHLLDKVGFRLDGDIIWMKGVAGNGTAWGSWRSASSPSLRDIHEYIIIASKSATPKTRLAPPKSDSVNTITKPGFLRSTMSVWYILPKTSKEHPAVFPLGVPFRLINLYTYTDDYVLDICAGTGQTVKACQILGRKGIGYEISEKYYMLMEKTTEALGKKILDQYKEGGWEDWFKRLDKTNLDYYF